MTDREMIEAALASNGFPVDSWDETGDDGLTAKIAGTFTATEDDERAGIYEGDEGTLYAICVGSDAHGNRRVMVWFVQKDYGYEAGNEVRDLSMLEHS